jgi:hypothetical protein
MRLTGLTADDWQVVTEYIDVLSPLKECTKRLEGRGAHGNFGAIAEIIPTFEYLLGELESRLQTYDDVEHDVHKDAPEDHLAINLRAALIKAREYYNKFDLSPAYYAATTLHPRYKTYCDTAWAANPKWLELNNGNFRVLWAQYRSLPKARTTTTRRPKSTNIDDAINSVLDPGSTDHEEDEFDLWKRREPQVEAGSEHAKNPILYWVELRDRYPTSASLRSTYSPSQPRAVSVSACLASWVTCWSLADEVYRPKFWQQSTALEGGEKLDLGAAMRWMR